jgi:hypothetical protein
MSIPEIEKLVNDKYFVYFLGFLWADGWISKKWNAIEICIVEDDFKALKSVLCKHIIWGILKKQKYRDGKLFGRPQIRITKHLPELKRFLFMNNYQNKSGGTPKKILAKIPHNLQRYWWRGYFDGDGSIAISKNGCKNLGFWSTINQDWSEHNKLAKCLCIKFNIYKYRRHCGYSSSFTTANKEYIKSFGKYIYPNSQYDFGLKRKFKKFKLL